MTRWVRKTLLNPWRIFHHRHRIFDSSTAANVIVLRISSEKITSQFLCALASSRPFLTRSQQQHTKCVTEKATIDAIVCHAKPHGPIVLTQSHIPSAFNRTISLMLPPLPFSSRFSSALSPEHAACCIPSPSVLGLFIPPKKKTRTVCFYFSAFINKVHSWNLYLSLMKIKRMLQSFVLNLKRKKSALVSYRQRICERFSEQNGRPLVQTKTHNGYNTVSNYDRRWPW